MNEPLLNNNNSMPELMERVKYYVHVGASALGYLPNLVNSLTPTFVLDYYDEEEHGNEFRLQKQKKTKFFKEHLKQSEGQIVKAHLSKLKEIRAADTAIELQALQTPFKENPYNQAYIQSLLSCNAFKVGVLLRCILEVVMDQTLFHDLMFSEVEFQELVADIAGLLHPCGNQTVPVFVYYLRWLFDPQEEDCQANFLQNRFILAIVKALREFLVKEGDQIKLFQFETYKSNNWQQILQYPKFIFSKHKSPIICDVAKTRTVAQCLSGSLQNEQYDSYGQYSLNQQLLFYTGLITAIPISSSFKELNLVLDQKDAYQKALADISKFEMKHYRSVCQKKVNLFAENTISYFNYMLQNKRLFNKDDMKELVSCFQTNFHYSSINYFVTDTIHLEQSMHYHINYESGFQVLHLASHWVDWFKDARILPVFVPFLHQLLAELLDMLPDRIENPGHMESVLKRMAMALFVSSKIYKIIPVLMRLGQLQLDVVLFLGKLASFMRSLHATLQKHKISRITESLVYNANASKEENEQRFNQFTIFDLSKMFETNLTKFLAESTRDESLLQGIILEEKSEKFEAESKAYLQLVDEVIQVQTIFLGHFFGLCSNSGHANYLKQQHMNYLTMEKMIPYLQDTINKFSPDILPDFKQMIEFKMRQSQVAQSVGLKRLLSVADQIIAKHIVHVFRIGIGVCVHETNFGEIDSYIMSLCKKIDFDHHKHV